MRKYTEKQSFNTSKIQKETLKKLDTYGYNVSQFIRDAISEKIQRDWPEIKSKKVKINHHF